MSYNLRDSLRAEAIRSWSQKDFADALHRIKLGDEYGGCFIRNVKTARDVGDLDDPENFAGWSFVYKMSEMSLVQYSYHWIKIRLTKDEVLAAISAGIRTYDGKKPRFRVPAGRG